MAKKRDREEVLTQGRIMPLADLVEYCVKENIRIWVETSSPPLYLPVDKDVLKVRTAEFYDFRQYHGIWVKIIMNDWLNSKERAIHCKYESYKDPRDASRHKEEEKQRKKIGTKIKLTKYKTNAKDQNLHRESLRKIRDRNSR